MPFISSIRKNHEISSPIDQTLEITGGDEIYTAGGYRIHIFTKVGDSEFSIRSKFPAGNRNISQLITVGALDAEYLIVAGGGAGATNLAGGGGAGGYREGAIKLTVNTTYPTSVGTGAAPSAPGSRYAAGANGGNSSVFGITLTGGGGGGAYPVGTGVGGGSGGGGGGGPGHHAGGGGGGAGSRGWWAPYPGPTGGQFGNGVVGQGHPGGRGGGNIHTAGQGGAGLGSAISGNMVVRAGGGGGSGHPSSPSSDRGHPGGGGGGGDGRQADQATPGATGATNTGGGGGSGSHFAHHGGGGGPGIIVVRYKTST
jgi:hypothetical protein